METTVEWYLGNMVTDSVLLAGRLMCPERKSKLGGLSSVLLVK